MTAIPSSTPQGLTGDNTVDAITSGYYWLLDSSRTLNWSLANGFYGQGWGDPGAAVASVDAVLRSVSYFADIDFNYVGYFLTPEYAANFSELSFSLAGGELFASTSTWGKTYYPNAAYHYTVYAGAPGDFFLNIDSPANALGDLGTGTPGFAFVMHGIGHALGLKHTFEAGGTGHPLLDNADSGIFDLDWLSVMSQGDDHDWTQMTWAPYSLMALDALGLMAMYGPNLATNAGNSVAEISGGQGYSTRWDASGTDTLSVAGGSRGWVVSLREATDAYLDIDIGLAYPAMQAGETSPVSFVWLLGTHENITGSAFGDFLRGNDETNIIAAGAGNDVLEGKGGNDSLQGGDGLDVARYGGDRIDFAVVNNSGTLTVAGSGTGTDTLTGIERLDFSDRHLAFDVTAGGHAGQAMELIGVLAPTLLNDLAVRGVIINLFDQGNSMADLCALALQLNLLPHATSAALANQVYQNVLGGTPAQEMTDYLVAYIAANGQANFVAAVAGLAINVDLVGLQQTGLEYTL